MLKKIIALVITGLSLGLAGQGNAATKTEAINTAVYKLAFRAYQNAIHDHIQVNNPLLTIIDFSLPSTKKRLWVIDPADQRILLNTWVAQGKNTGLNLATHFSNRIGSKESSLGLYSTGQTYVGSDGYSLELNGLDNNFNNNAKRRNIVMHGAWYVSPNFIKTHHYLGRSWGCFALDNSMLVPTIKLIKNHSLVFAYYPNPYWMAHSRFLT